MVASLLGQHSNRFNRQPLSLPNLNNLQLKLDSIYLKGYTYTGGLPQRISWIKRLEYDSLNRHVATLTYNNPPQNTVAIFEDLSYNTLGLINKYTGTLNNGIRDTIQHEYWQYNSNNLLIEYMLNSPGRHSLSLFTYGAGNMVQSENFLVNGSWTPKFYNTHYYNASGLVVNIKDSSLLGGLWRLTGNQEYYYTNTRLDSSTLFLRDNLNQPFARLRTNYVHDATGAIVGDTTKDLYSAWMPASISQYAYDNQYYDTSIATYFGYDFPFKIDSLKTWIKYLGMWYQFDSIAYFYSPISTVALEEQRVVDCKVYPNPASDVLQIEIGSTKNIDQILIYNTLGQIVRVKQSPQREFRIDISNLNGGYYFLVLEYFNKHRSVYKFQKTSKD